MKNSKMPRRLKECKQERYPLWETFVIKDNKYIIEKILKIEDKLKIQIKRKIKMKQIIQWLLNRIQIKSRIYWTIKI